MVMRESDRQGKQGTMEGDGWVSGRQGERL
jgi:hypothetical protein